MWRSSLPTSVGVATGPLPQKAGRRGTAGKSWVRAEYLASAEPGGKGKHESVGNARKNSPFVALQPALMRIGYKPVLWKRDGRWTENPPEHRRSGALENACSNINKTGIGVATTERQHSLAGWRRPILRPQSRDTDKFAAIRGDQKRVTPPGLRRDEDVISADR